MQNRRELNKVRVTGIRTIKHLKCNFTLSSFYIILRLARFEVITAVLLIIQVFWDVMQCHTQIKPLLYHTILCPRLFICYVLTGWGVADKSYTSRHTFMKVINSQKLFWHFALSYCWPNSTKSAASVNPWCVKGGGGGLHPHPAVLRYRILTEAMTN